jgi:cobalt-zinc-cadmium efflux system outer membrane protein
MPVFPFTRLLRVARRAVVGLVLAGLAAPALSFPTVPPLAPPALRQAVNDAWRKHPASAATEAALVAARARTDAAGQPIYNPEVVVNAEDEGGDRTTTAGLAMSFDVGGKRGARHDAARARLDGAVAQARLDRIEFAAAWLAGWAELQNARLRVAQGEQRLAVIARFAELAERQLAVGDISSLDRDLATLALNEALAEQSLLQADVAAAEEAFTVVGGNPADLAMDPEGWRQLPPSLETTADAWQSLPEWQIAQSQALAAERDVTVARRDRIADPTVELTGGRIDFGPTSDNVVGIEVSVPLFVRNTYRAEVVAAQGEADAAVAHTERVRIELQARVARTAAAYAAVQRAWARWQQTSGADLDKRTELLERLWRAGEISTADYLQQLEQSLDTALAGAELEGRLWRTSIEYLAATGQLERWLGLTDANGDLSR